jgi:hypothetical protein
VDEGKNDEWMTLSSASVWSLCTWKKRWSIGLGRLAKRRSNDLRQTAVSSIDRGMYQSGNKLSSGARKIRSCAETRKGKIEESRSRSSLRLLCGQQKFMYAVQ